MRAGCTLGHVRRSRPRGSVAREGSLMRRIVFRTRLRLRRTWNIVRVGLRPDDRWMHITSQSLNISIDARLLTGARRSWNT